MSKKLKIIIGVVIVAVVISPFVGYYLAVSSEPYNFSKQVIQNSASIKQTVGEVQSIRLAPFGYSIKYTGPEGSAEFESRVIGSKGSANLNIKLKKNLGTWEVIAAQLNGQPITL